MDSRTATQLLELNRTFYQTFSGSFSATRQRLQQGVQRTMRLIPSGCRLLDLGCGNGNFALGLTANGFKGSYTGIDFSEELISIARNLSIPNANFYTADLTSENWSRSFQASSFEYISSFATLHHLPGEELRKKFFSRVYNLLSVNGIFVFSNWQFLNSPSLKKRIQPWERVGLNAKQLDSGDYLLDWRRDGEGLRYVHQYSLSELQNLAEEAGFEVLEYFYSDGRTGNLGLYVVCKKIQHDAKGK